MRTDAEILRDYYREKIKEVQRLPRVRFIRYGMEETVHLLEEAIDALPQPEVTEA